MKQQQFWTLPNTITSLRVLATVPVILLIVSGEKWALWAALCIMVLSEFSDWIDGVLAGAGDRCPTLANCSIRWPTASIACLCSPRLQPTTGCRCGCC
ncbi:MAG: hypothetical protein HC868_05025 [Sphingomonadales bacterium]|nr:hypothetical protein [Sphingomonadales bacterium]